MRLCTPDDVDPAALHAFLERFFGATKADFLDRHGAWWHDGQEQRLVLEKDGVIAAYCGVIPVRIHLGGETREGLWWMDLVVAPEFRGQGLQTILDLEVRKRCDLLLGFPNELASRIHLKHGWGVRDDLRVLLAPLDPARLGPVRRARGVRGAALRGAARMLTPLTSIWRWRLARYVPTTTRQVDEPDVHRWAELAERMPYSTTIRDEAHLRRRYLDAPYRDELRFYESATQVLIVRRLTRGSLSEERILDFFGDLSDPAGLQDLLRCSLSEAARRGVSQVTALVGPEELAGVFRRSGFLLSSPGRFCWSSPDPGVMDALRNARLHWTFGDSDNDDPALMSP